MTESQEDALQAAMLAKFVGSNLNQIDSLSIDRRTIPANRLNINDFISKVSSPNNTNNINNYNSNPSGFASPPPEDLIKQMVPDVVPRTYTDQPVNSTPPISTFQNSDKIENLLENINKNLELLVSFIKNG